MFTEQRGFRPPKSNIQIWRYTNFEKFIDLLDNEELFFCRLDKFQDPFEGIFRLKDYENTKVLWRDEHKIKQFYFANCWHQNKFQSDAMWKIYLDTNNGIAIKSSFDKLVKSLEETEEEIHISQIRYINQNTTTFNELMNENINEFGSSLNQFTYKRIAFEHEKELKLYYIDMPIPGTVANAEEREPLNYRKIKVNLNELVQEIVISPLADKWFKDLVERLLKNYKKNYTVSQSMLYELIKEGK